VELFSAYVVAPVVPVQLSRRAIPEPSPVKRDTIQLNLDPLQRIGTEGGSPMIHIAGKASEQDSQILHAAIGLGSQIRAASEEIEQGRRIPPSLAAAMKGAGVFGMVMPCAWGGPELDPMAQFRVIEALAMVDGSVGFFIRPEHQSERLGCYEERFNDWTRKFGARTARRLYYRHALLSIFDILKIGMIGALLDWIWSRFGGKL
jgi:hypothetical protein